MRITDVDCHGVYAGASDSRARRFHRTRVPVNGEDPAGRANEVSQDQGYRAGSTAHVGHDGTFDNPGRFPQVLFHARRRLRHECVRRHQPSLEAWTAAMPASIASRAA